MRNLQILLVFLCIGATWQALADNPPAEPAKPEKPAAAALEEQTKRLRAMGYKPEVQNGVTVFCRKETPMGTRFEKKICGNGDEIERNAQAARDALQNGPRQSR
jgi:hypothetical protein